MCDREKHTSSFTIDSILSTANDRRLDSPEKTSVGENVRPVTDSRGFAKSEGVNDTTCREKMLDMKNSRVVKQRNTYKPMSSTPAQMTTSPKRYSEDPSLSKCRKKTRTVFSRHQIFYLESAFDTKRYLSSTERAEIAATLNLSETQVKVWFQNRRNKWKSQISGDSSLHNERYPVLPFGGRFSLPLGALTSPLHPAHMLYF